MDKRITTYLQYGVPIDKAKSAIANSLSASTFKKLSKEQLISKYNFNNEDIDFIKHCLNRNPIDENIINTLLERNNYMCCICKGEKSDAYIIHHIEEYSISQNNSYDNLAVLCPNDHDLAHRKGIHLTNKLTPKQIKAAKDKWEKLVQSENVRKASLTGEVTSIDYVNIPRILEECRGVLGRIPITKYSESLIRKEFIHDDGNLNINKLNELNINLNQPLNFFGPLGATELSLYFFELVKLIMNMVNFEDLDILLNKTELRKGLIGKYCYYVGGLYGKNPKFPIKETTPNTHVYLRRNGFFVEWNVDPHYMTSNSAATRLGERTVYIVYGRIRNVGEKVLKGKKHTHIDIRPFAFGMPISRKDRTPLVHYKFQNDDLLD